MTTNARLPSPAPPAESFGLRARIVTLCVSLVIAGALAETVARLMFPPPPIPDREPQLVFETHASMGFRAVPNQVGWLDDGRATINSLGLRGAEPGPRVPGTVRVLAVGDSTTFGWGVHDDETYPSFLEARLKELHPERAFEVINAGVSGHNLDHIAGSTREIVPLLRPDLLIVGVLWNDLPHRQSAAGKPSASSDSTPSAIDVRRREFRMANRQTGLTRLLRRSRLVLVLRHTVLHAVGQDDEARAQLAWERALMEGQPSPAVDAAWSAVEAALRDLRAIADLHSARVGLVPMPMRAQVEARTPQRSFQQRLAMIGRAEGIAVLDPLSRLLEEADRSGLFLAYDRMHLTARGNRVLAEGIAAQFGAAFPALIGRERVPAPLSLP